MGITQCNRVMLHGYARLYMKYVNLIGKTCNLVELYVKSLKVGQYFGFNILFKEKIVLRAR